MSRLERELPSQSAAVETSDRSAIEGFVDGFDGLCVIGWAHDCARPGQRLHIAVTFGDDVVTVVADQERADVAATGRNDGFCGFAVVCPPDVTGTGLIHVRETSTGLDLPGSPIDPVGASSSVFHADDDSQIEGCIDFVDGNRIVGWARDRALPGRRVSVEIAIGSEVVTLTADRYRRDVADHGMGDGFCGFEFAFDRGAAGRRLIHVREAGTRIALGGSPFRADVLNRIADPRYPALLALIRREARLALPRGRTDAPDTARSEARAPAATALQHLLSPADEVADPEGLISRYAAFEILRSERIDLVPDGSLVERMQVLHWYLTRAGAYHGMPVPLSPQQITYLNAPMPLLGIDAEISVAAYAFITCEADADLDLRDPAGRERALYWWCVDRSDAIAPGGELITPAQVRVLTTRVEPSSGDCPLTVFLKTFHARDAGLAPIALQSDAGRVVLATIVMLRTLSAPHLVKLVPREYVVTLLRCADPERRPLLDDLLAIVLGAPGAPDHAQGAAIGDRVRRLLDREKHAGCAVQTAGSGLPFMRDPRFSAGLDPGVAVIGPICAVSGLGQAARLSLAVLEAAGLQPAALDFFPGNPSPVGFADRTGCAALHTPRRINLLHLNAEVVPHAFALLDRRLTEQSYNIGYFFWELDTVPDAHRLAFDLLDEIWVASEYNRETYARATHLPVHNVGMAVATIPETPVATRFSLGLPEEAFIFLATFDSFSYVERKNPLGLVTAFQAAFPVASAEPVALVIKTQNRSRIVDPHQLAIWRQIASRAVNDPRIIIVDRTLPYADLIGLTRTCDAYVSLHRSEGWGFGALEAMQLGVPVVATAYGGTLEFCSPETAFLVDYDLIPVRADDYIYAARDSRWAQPALASTVEALRSVYTDRALRERKAAAGQQCVRTAFGLASIGRRYAKRLSEIEILLKDRART